MILESIAVVLIPTLLFALFCAADKYRDRHREAHRKARKEAQKEFGWWMDKWEPK